MTIRLGKSRPEDGETITASYRRQYEQMHFNSVNYGRGGLGNLPRFIEWLQTEFEDGFRGARRILDYGCGKGWAVLELGRLFPDATVKGYDPCIEEYSERPKMKFDAIYSTDVFEHFEPEKLDACLQDIASLAAPGCAYFFLIAMTEADQILPDGRNAHLIVEREPFWLDAIERNIPMVDRGSITTLDKRGKPTRLFVWGRAPEAG